MLNPPSPSWCVGGIIADTRAGSSICCKRECGTCGGADCAKRFRHTLASGDVVDSKQACCKMVIFKLGRTCNSSYDDACVIPLRNNYTHPLSEPSPALIPRASPPPLSSWPPIERSTGGTSLGVGVQEVLPAATSSCQKYPPPTLASPFFFFHLPKAGGTSLRTIVARDARRLNVTPFIPCKHGLKCAWFLNDTVNTRTCPWNASSHPMACMYPKIVQCSAILGGHFGVSFANALLRTGDVGGCRGPSWQLPRAVGTRQVHRAVETTPSISCIMNFRHPVERLLSCHEFFLRNGGKTFRSLSHAEMLHVVEECGGNASVAYFGGGEYDLRIGKSLKRPPFGGSLEVAKANVDMCFVVLLERWGESLRILGRAFPWSSFGAASNQKMKLQRSKHDGMSSLPFPIQKTLERMLSGDMELYFHALRKFGQQIQCYLGGAYRWLTSSETPKRVETTKENALGALRRPPVPILQLVDDYSLSTGTQKHRGGWRTVMQHLRLNGIVVGDSSPADSSWTQSRETKETLLARAAAIFSNNTQSALNSLNELSKREILHMLVTLQQENLALHQNTVDDKIAFVDCVEHRFVFGKHQKDGPILRPWVGVIHFVDDLPIPQYHSFERLAGVLSRPDFIASLPYCLMLLALSETCAAQVRLLVPGVNVQTIFHPAPTGLVPFDLQAFSSNRNRSVVFLGAQYRRISTLFRLLGSNFERVWLPGRNGAQTEDHFRRFVLPDLPTAMLTDVNIRYIEDWDEYDALLRENIVLIDLVAASASNSILHCASARLPCLIRRLPAVEEYIGKDYPLYFSSFAELQAILRDESQFLQKVRQATDYFSHARLEQTTLSQQSFAVNLSVRVDEALKEREKLEESMNRPRVPPLKKLVLNYSGIKASCHVRGGEVLRIALGFYGFAARSLPYTLDGLQTNLIAPLRKVSGGALDIFVHSMYTSNMGSRHFTRESKYLSSPMAHMALEPCRHALADQNSLSEQYGLDSRARLTYQLSQDTLHPFNDLPTVFRIFVSRMSIFQLSKLILRHEAHRDFLYHIVVAARPDTTITAPFVLPNVWEMMTQKVADIWVPDFAHGHGSHGVNSSVAVGVNDRFAFGLRTAMLKGYMTQFDEQLNETQGIKMIGSEHLLCSHLRAKNIKIQFARICVVRVRADGFVPPNDLIDPRGPRKPCPRSAGARCCDPIRAGNEGYVASFHNVTCFTDEFVRKVWEGWPAKQKPIKR